MEIGLLLLVSLIALAVGGIAGSLYYARRASRQLAATRQTSEVILEEARSTEKALLLEAKEEALRLRAQGEDEVRERRQEVLRQERRLSQKEEALDRKLEGYERREHSLAQKEEQQDQRLHQIDELKAQREQELERAAQLSRTEAREVVLREVEEEVRDEALRRAYQKVETIREEAADRARQILALTIHRLASEVCAETTTTVVPIPSDDMKGRIIGREGRNIRALEAATGVDLIIDDTPEAVTLSCFDPVRREIARIALQKLLVDGRIHPSRIEEMVNKAKAEVDDTIRKEGEGASRETGVPLPPEIIKIFGRLKWRQSYGQNVLQHSIEVSHLAGMLAAEIGANVQVCKAGGLLHDLGKAVDHEVEGGHDEIGDELVRRHMRSPEVARAVHDHHHERDEMSIEGAIVSAADAISASRPGARKESLENYIKRLEALENVASTFEGVEKAYAVQAGREVRVFVRPQEVDDLGAMRMARDLARKIEGTLAYPGQIKVTLIRETRAVEYAK